MQPAIPSNTSPIVTLCQSAFTDALNTTAPDSEQTALDALESLTVHMRLPFTSKCGMCDGEGKCYDGFQGDKLETCPKCKGTGEITVIVIPGNSLPAILLVNQLVKDLRAASDASQGGAV